MKIQKHINDAVVKEQEERKGRKGSGCWKPSNLGRCYRLQYWARKGEEVTNPPEISAVKRMNLGTLIHDYIQEKYPKEMVEIKVQSSDVLGYADLVDEDTVADIKSVTDWSYKFVKDKTIEQIREAKFTNWLQVATYGIILGKFYIKLFFVNTKDIHQTAEYEDTVSHWVPIVEKEFKVLRDFWAKDKLPPAEPRAFGGKDCQYCAYADKCKEVE